MDKILPTSNSFQVTKLAELYVFYEWELIGENRLSLTLK